MTMLNPGGRASSEHFRFLLDLSTTANDQAASIAALDAAVTALEAQPPGVEYAYGQQTTNNTLTSTTAVQKLFSFSTNGALTLATGRYRFNCKLYLSTMNATSGNGAFHLLGAGTATLANILYVTSGIDNNAPLSAGTRTGSAATTQNSPASMVTAGTGTGLIADIDGMFNVTVTGTIIPSIALVTANAAVVLGGSYFECIRIGASNTQGAWS